MKKRIVVFSGAGISAESGIPTFRDSDGLWENHRIEDVATTEAWFRDKEFVLNFYRQRFDNIMKCMPNDGHKAIARLAQSFDVIAITQNIDTLHETAGISNVWHIHGRADIAKCEFHSDITTGYDPQFRCTYKTPILEPIKFGDVCPRCKNQLRPDVVWFGEAVDMRHEYLEELLETTLIFICVGTSAQVYPAAGLIEIFRNVPNKYLIDVDPIYVEDFIVLQGKSSVELPKLVEKILKVDNEKL